MSVLASLVPWLVYPKIIATGGAVHGLIILTAADSSGSSSDNTLKVSLVAGLALVLAAAVPNLLALFKKPEPVVEPKSVEELRRANAKIIKDLEDDRDEWKTTAEAAIRGTEIRDGELDRLRRMVIDLGGNPFPPHVTAEDQR